MVTWTGSCAGGGQGPQGDPGPPGEDGADGAQGPKGDPGDPGADGSPGADGADGAPGADGTDGAGLPSGLAVSVVRRTSDQTFNSSTLANVSGMSFAVTSGRTYHFKFVLLVRSDTATVGLRTSVTVPPITRFGATVETIIAGAGASSAFNAPISASDGAATATAVPAINTDYVLTLEGILIPSATGTLQLRAATETGTTVVTVRQGSVGYLWDHGT